ncbi:MAG: Qb-snare protein, Bos1/Membrin family [Monoraphidium minutum]|nr:MAG: Qb-snare protein, Bos1/Membrin family [Monoraphidium minutum]
MGDLSALHAQATRLILALREGMERLEAIEGGFRTGDPTALARDLQLKLSELQRTSRELDSTWRMQMVRQGTTKVDVWKRKVAAVSEEADVLSSSLDRFGGREARRRREQAEREELMAEAAVGRRYKDEMDEEAAVAGHVLRSRRALADMFEQGSGILAGMAGGRERIKAAQKKMLDVINSVGLGDSVLRMIERRHRTDAYIALGGMAVVVLFTGGLLWWAWR